MRDLIERQKAIDALGERPIVWTDDDQYALGERNQFDIDRLAIETLPSAQPEIEKRKEKSAQNVPKEDLISRNAAIDAECEVCQIAPKKERGHNCTYYVHGCKEIECLRALPSAQPEPCKDAVSRADVVDMLEMFPFTEYSEYETAREVVKRLPSAQPESHYCRECKWSRCHIDMDKYGNTETSWHCRNWGGGTDEEGYCHEWERKTDE